MMILNQAGMPDSRQFHPQYYNAQTQSLNLSQLITQQNMDVRQVQYCVKEYLDSLQPSQVEKYFDTQQLSHPLIGKIFRYENLSLILTEMSHLLAHLAPECTKQSCPTMLATVEWKFLCTVHGQEPQDCCAASYSSHFLDSGLPTFLKLCQQDFTKADQKQAVNEALKNYQFVERRSYRILAHGYFHHKQAFTQFERERFLYRRFIKYLNVYANKQVA